MKAMKIQDKLNETTVRSDGNYTWAKEPIEKLVYKSFDNALTKEDIKNYEGDFLKDLLEWIEDKWTPSNHMRYESLKSVIKILNFYH